MLDRHAEQRRSVKSFVIDLVAQVKRVDTSWPPVPDWFALFDKCLELLEFY